MFIRRLTCLLALSAVLALPEDALRIIKLGEYAQRPGVCTQGQDVFLCVGSGCSSPIYLCMSGNAWSPITNGISATGTANQYAYWSTGSTLTSSAKMLNGAAYAGGQYTPNGPVVVSNLGSAGYFSTVGAGPNSEGYVLDFLQSTSQSSTFWRLVDHGGNLGTISSTGSGWSMSGINLQGSLPSTVPIMDAPVVLTGQTGSIGTTAFSTFGAFNRKLVVYSLNSSAGAGTVSLTISWTDPTGNANTFTTSTLVGGAGTQLSGVVLPTGSSTISYATTVVGTITYRLYLNGQQLN